LYCVLITVVICEKERVYGRASLLWKSTQGIRPVKILTPKLEVGFNSFEIDSIPNGELIYNTFLLNKREQKWPVLSVESLDDIGGMEKDTNVRYPW
jgi:hypothetical protein